MGDSTVNSFTPFFINYTFESPDLAGPLKPPTRGCNEPYDVSFECLAASAFLFCLFVSCW